MELTADLALRLDAGRPGDDRAVAGAAPVRGNLLGPLVGGVHGVRPADRIVVVGFRRAEFVDVLAHVLGRHQCYDFRRGAVERDHLVEAALGRALGAGPVVADDVVDQRIVQDLQVLQRVDQAANVIIGVLQEPGVHLHLPGQDGSLLDRHILPGGDLRRALRQLGLGWDDAQCLLARERLGPKGIPALVELALVLVRPLLRHVVRRVRRAGREVDEERLVGHERLLLAHPVDGLVGHVLREVIAFLWRLLRLDRMGAFVDAGVVLVGLAADEAVEVLEAAARAGPAVEGPHRAGLPHRHLVALAELGRRVAVQLQCLGQRRAGIGPHRGVARRRGGHFRDAAHARTMVVAAGQQRLSGGRTQRSGVKAVVLEPIGRQALGRGRVDRATEGRRGAKAAVVDEDDEHVGGALGRPQRHDRRILRIRVLGIVGRQPDGWNVGDREDLPLDLVLDRHGSYSFATSLSAARTAASTVGKLRPSSTKPVIPTRCANCTTGACSSAT